MEMKNLWDGDVISACISRYAFMKVPRESGINRYFREKCYRIDCYKWQMVHWYFYNEWILIRHRSWFDYMSSWTILTSWWSLTTVLVFRWPPATNGTPIYTPPPRRLSLPREAYLLCGWPPILCLFFAWVQDTANLVLVCAMVFNPFIAVHNSGISITVVSLPHRRTRRLGPLIPPWFAPAASLRKRALGSNTLSTRRTPPQYTTWSTNFWSLYALFPPRKPKSVNHVMAKYLCDWATKCRLSRCQGYCSNLKAVES